MPSVVLYAEPKAKADVVVVFYRAFVQAVDTKPVDALIKTLKAQKLKVLAVAITSLKQEEVKQTLKILFKRFSPSVAVNLTGFSGGILSSRMPTIQAMLCGNTLSHWRASQKGLEPREIAMNVALPELDGRIISRAIAFKQTKSRDATTELEQKITAPLQDRIAFVANQCQEWLELAKTPQANRKVAVILANYPNRNGRIGNGVGLDAASSLVRLLKRLGKEGYTITNPPQTAAKLMARLLNNPTNKLATIRKGEVSYPLRAYLKRWHKLPPKAQRLVTAKWGGAGDDPFVQSGQFVLPLSQLGNVVVGIQPARGYNIDPEQTFHDPDLPPPHGYLAFYFYLQQYAHCFIHLGKHGNAEWLPGKSLALSGECFPEIVAATKPNFYPFIVNDPGEGTQAKRRLSAVIIDHLTPPLRRAELYGELAELEALTDEYHEAAFTDPKRLELLAEKILSLAGAHKLDRDCSIDPDASAQAKLAQIDEYLCTLKERQIRDGLHILGTAPKGDRKNRLMLAIARAKRGEATHQLGITTALAEDLADELGTTIDPRDCALGEKWQGNRPAILHNLEGDFPQWRTNGNTVERLEALALQLIALGNPFALEPAKPTEENLSPENLSKESPTTKKLDTENLTPENPSEENLSKENLSTNKLTRTKLTPTKLTKEQLTPKELNTEKPNTEKPNTEKLIQTKLPKTKAVLEWIHTFLAPSITRGGRDEFNNLLRGMDGKFVPPAPSGAPTRGKADVLPTGRNFYSVDPKSLPTPTAWALGWKSASRLIDAYKKSHHKYPRKMGLSAWGTSNMRTGGDDISQAMALLGVKPTWDEGRVMGFEILPLEVLGRPRVDVTLRVSGFFRDAFPNLIALFDKAVRAVATLDEPASHNPLVCYNPQNPQNQQPATQSQSELGNQNSAQNLHSAQNKASLQSQSELGNQNNPPSPHATQNQNRYPSQNSTQNLHSAQSQKNQNRYPSQNSTQNLHSAQSQKNQNRYPSQNSTQNLHSAQNPQNQNRHATSQNGEPEGLFRVFGPKPGAYGAGLQALIDENGWETQKDLANIYLEWGSTAYTAQNQEGEAAGDAFRANIKNLEAVIHNQDNFEHDILDSDDYYQFVGGMTAAVTQLSGKEPVVYLNDHSVSHSPKIQTLPYELAKVVRSRAANPLWIKGVMRHGYRGAAEMAATVDYLFAFAATTSAVKDHHFDMLFNSYLADAKVLEFIRKNNKDALEEMTAKFKEAIARGLWKPQRNSVFPQIQLLTKQLNKATANKTK